MHLFASLTSRCIYKWSLSRCQAKQASAPAQATKRTLLFTNQTISTIEFASRSAMITLTLCQYLITPPMSRLRVSARHCRANITMARLGLPHSRSEVTIRASTARHHDCTPGLLRSRSEITVTRLDCATTRLHARPATLTPRLSLYAMQHADITTLVPSLHLAICANVSRKGYPTAAGSEAMIAPDSNPGHSYNSRKLP